MTRLSGSRRAARRCLPTERRGLIGPHFVLGMTVKSNVVVGADQVEQIRRRLGVREVALNAVTLWKTLLEVGSERRRAVCAS